MPIDYSKWDKLELSDDDDFECHPNVDKASFIRWKQADIHQKREDRRRKIEVLKLEISNNEVLLGRINDMIQQLQTGGVETFLQTIEKLRETNKKIASEAKEKETSENTPQKEGEQLAYPTFDQMMGALFEKIQEEVKHESPEKVEEELINKLSEHRKKLSQRQKEIKQELDKEEREAKKKITMDDMHTGFDKSSVSKVTKQEPPKPKSKKTEKKKEKVIEVLNPETQMKSLDTEVAEVAEADDDDDDDEEVLTSELAKEFAAITDYDRSFEFITKHPEVVSQEIVDQILAESFQSQLKGKAKYAKQAVHQAWLLQYCQKLGKDGVTLFFKRITAPNPQAREVFMKDVTDTYDRIRERCQIMAAEKTQKPQPAKQVEQIQIEVTDPNMSLNVRIPDENATSEEEKTRRQLFEKLPVDFQEALNTKDIKNINKVLGEMTVENAEEVLKICGDADILSIEPGIIDTTQGEVVPGQELDSEKTLVDDNLHNAQKAVS